MGLLIGRSHTVCRPLDSFAIQDVLRIIREARDLDSFIRLLASALRLGTGVGEMQILVRSSSGMVPGLKEGPFIMPEMITAVEAIRENEVITFTDGCQVLVFPMQHRDWIAGYILIWSFTDTILVDGERIKLLSIISSIIEEPFTRLLERQSVVRQEVLDLSQLVLFRVEQEINRLEDLGLDATVIRIRNDEPHNIISACREWAEGLLVLQELQRENIKVYRTDLNGAITIRSDGVTSSIEAYR